MGNDLNQIAENTSVFLTVVILGLILLEWAVLLIAKQSKRNKEGVVNIASAGLAFLPIFILQKVLFVGLMFWLYEYRMFVLGTDWYVWLLGWIAYDFMFWFIHFISHRVRLFWCLHSVHHQPKEMKLSVGFRGSLFDFILTPHNVIWLPLIGFNPLMVLLIDSVGKIYGVLVHIHERWAPELRWKWIEKLLITPTLHRIHHSTNHIYLDRNYGEAFSFWDRIFGTFQPEIDNERIEYGVMKDTDSENLFDSQTDEFLSLWNDLKSATKYSDKLKYLFYPPGWNHTDGGMLAEDFRQLAWKKKHLS